MLLGVLTSHMQACDILFPEPVAPFLGLGFSNLQSFVSSITVPDWSTQARFERQTMRNYDEGFRHGWYSKSRAKHSNPSDLEALLQLEKPRQFPESANFSGRHSCTIAQHVKPTVDFEMVSIKAIEVKSYSSDLAKNFRGVSL